MKALSKEQSESIIAWLTEVSEQPIDLANQFEKAFPNDEIPTFKARRATPSSPLEVNYDERKHKTDGDKRLEDYYNNRKIKNLSRLL